MQDQELNKNYQFNKSATNNDKYIKRMQLIIFVLDHL